VIAQDVKDFITRNLAPADHDQAVWVLSGARIETGAAPSPRLMRCALIASGGSLEQLRAQVARMKVDWRDVIIAGEYVSEDGTLKQVRDLSVPFALPPNTSLERSRGG
jgi:hypothetical protein